MPLPAETPADLVITNAVVLPMDEDDRVINSGAVAITGRRIAWVGPAVDAPVDGARRVLDVDGAIVRPLPLQEGGIPFWIAGGGEKVTLRIAAKFAQYTNFDGTPEGFAAKSSILEGHCLDVGTDYNAITRSANYNVMIGSTQAEVDDRRAWALDHYTKQIGAERAAAAVAQYSSGACIGTPEQIVENLTAMRRLGLTYTIVNFPELAYDTSGQELFESEVIPALV